MVAGVISDSGVPLESISLCHFFITTKTYPKISRQILNCSLIKPSATTPSRLLLSPGTYSGQWASTFINALRWVLSVIERKAPYYHICFSYTDTHCSTALYLDIYIQYNPNYGSHINTITNKVNKTQIKSNKSDIRKNKHIHFSAQLKSTPLCGIDTP